MWFRRLPNVGVSDDGALPFFRSNLLNLHRLGRRCVRSSKGAACVVKELGVRYQVGSIAKGWKHETNACGPIVLPGRGPAFAAPDVNSANFILPHCRAAQQPDKPPGFMSGLCAGIVDALVGVSSVLPERRRLSASEQHECTTAASGRALRGETRPAPRNFKQIRGRRFAGDLALPVMRSAGHRDSLRVVW